LLQTDSSKYILGKNVEFKVSGENFSKIYHSLFLSPPPFFYETKRFVESRVARIFLENKPKLGKIYQMATKYVSVKNIPM
jgi:hypothetical protein